jgi:hypothetical protein
MPLNSFAPVALAAAATAAGPAVIQLIVCGALAPRASETSSLNFYAVIASFLRRTLVTGDFDATALHAVSLSDAEQFSDSLIEFLIACLESLECGTHREHALFEFEVDYFVDGHAMGDAVLARTCGVVRRYRHTLRRLKVPSVRQSGAPAYADALAECTAITSLDLSLVTFPFRSWRQLGPTLHSLVLRHIGGDGTDVTFRLLADNMPALRELEFYARHQPSQDGFIELVSRLRSLFVRARLHPWDSVHYASAWPLTLPNLETLRWWGDGNDVDDAVAVAILRRAVGLRAADVSHASALAAIAAGPVASIDSCGGAIIPPLPSCMSAPLSNVKTLTLTAVANDPVSLAATRAASPRVSALTLRWNGTAPRLWSLLRTTAAASAVSGADGTRWHRVRRVDFDVDSSVIIAAPNPEAPQCVRALFPRARYASWGATGSPHMALF